MIPSLRNEIESLLPAGTFLRIDRTGQALYAAAIDEATAAHLQDKGWQCTLRGRICLIAPGESHLQSLRAHASLKSQWQRFADRPADTAILPLLWALLRATEMPPTPADLRKLEKQLRQTTAVCLRTGTGGGLEICETLFRQISP